MLKPFGGEIHKIRLGLDLGIYYPRESCASDSDNTLVILAMARPRTPWRGFATLVKSLASLKSQFPKIEIRLFGDDLKNQSVPFPYEDLGIVVARNTLCQVYSGADIFIDASDFQGFGRAALEAMACGTACVVTDVGGVNEYARDGVNALMVSPKTPDKLTDAVVKLIDDNHLRHRLVKNGYETVKAYCHKREAQKTAELFQKTATTHDHS
jgi:glycosyltransferase involved in cell wall biosynthesis